MTTRPTEARHTESAVGITQECTRKNQDTALHLRRDQVLVCEDKLHVDEAERGVLALCTNPHFVDVEKKLTILEDAVELEFTTLHERGRHVFDNFPRLPVVRRDELSSQTLARKWRNPNSATFHDFNPPLTDSLESPQQLLGIMRILLLSHLSLNVSESTQRRSQLNASELVAHDILLIQGLISASTLCADKHLPS